MAGPRSPRLDGGSIRVLIATTSVVVAVVLAARQFAGVSVRSVVTAVAGTPAGAILAAIAFTAASYGCLGLTEWYALRLLQRRRPTRALMPLSLVANAITNSTGFGMATGVLVRLQLYRPLQLRAKTITVLVATTSAANILSGLAVIGMAMAATALASATGGSAPSGVLVSVGLVLLAAAIAAFTLFRREEPRGPTEVAVRRGPGTPGRLLALAASSGDWLFSGLALFVLGQARLETLAPSLIVFVAGSELGSIVGAPAALGVLDAMVLAFHPGDLPVHRTAAALLVYRLIYFAAPFGAALASIAVSRVLGPRWRAHARAPRSGGEA